MTPCEVFNMLKCLTPHQRRELVANAYTLNYRIFWKRLAKSVGFQKIGNAPIGEQMLANLRGEKVQLQENHKQAGDLVLNYLDSRQIAAVEFFDCVKPTQASTNGRIHNPPFIPAIQGDHSLFTECLFRNAENGEEQIFTANHLVEMVKLLDQENLLEELNRNER